MIEPPPFAAIHGITLRVARAAPIISTVKLDRHASSSSGRTMAIAEALLTNTSTRPNAPYEPSRKASSEAASPIRINMDEASYAEVVSCRTLRNEARRTG